MKLSEVLVDVGKCSVKRQLIAKKGQLIAKKRHLIESSVICSVVFLVLASLISSCDGVPLFGSQKPHGNNISDNGKLMYLKFSTRLDLSSDLIRRDFHIVQLRLDEELVDIHLHRDTDLVHPTVVGYVHSVAAEAGGQTPPLPPEIL
ncbi:hypothetical protein Fcan01_19424 [Folsomia candida]|uniref:Uncharacterized protein n=1 Tax=Folsomia candida TaxID=158441 RepID=A0A226DLR5_FOLCA|nr:hypothetical protein Fcan01_19424 [Folsomia candida]